MPVTTHDAQSSCKKDNRLMIRNYFKIALRHVLRRKLFSFINIIGLAIGFACTMLIASFIYDEFTFDRYAKQSKNIYRIGLQIEQNGGLDEYPNVDVAVGAGIRNAFPEVEASTRMFGNLKDYVRYGDAQFKEQNIFFADSNFLDIFSIPLLEGNALKALTEPNSIVISEVMAKKYFGDKSAIGETLSFKHHGLFKVTGVMEGIPVNSHFHTEALVSMTSNRYAVEAQTWSNIGFYTYVLLNEHADPKQLEAKFAPLIDKYVVPEIQKDMNVSGAEAQKMAGSWRFYLMPLHDIHLHASTKYELETNGDIRYVYIFGVLAFFILLLACINFTNLSTAGSAKRSREIGVRKAMGSMRNHLIYQFLSESVMLSLMAMVLALGLAVLLLPFFNDLTGKQITVIFFLQPAVLVILLVAGIAVGLLAGIYPAFVLSAFNAIQVLKGKGATSLVKRGGLDNVLVVFQFTISTALIMATIVVFEQVTYMQSKKMGYNKDQVVVIENAAALGQNEANLRDALTADHRVASVSISNDAPMGKNAMSYWGTEVYAKGGTTGTIHSMIFNIDEEYLETLQMQLLAGRNFSRQYSGDSSAVLINESAMRDLGWDTENVIGQTIIRSGQKEYHVAGLVADFHVGSAKQKIAPLMMMRGSNEGSMILRVETEQITEFLKDLQEKWHTYQADVPMDFYFLDERFANLYKSEKTTEQLFIVFVFIAISIASLGLYGLSLYAVEQRVKEIGIRKVLGSSVGQIALLLSRKFLYLVLLGIVLSMPLAWWSMNRWLENFAYRIDVGVWMFSLAGMTAIIIAACTVSYQTIKAALTNPVDSLRAE